MCTLLPKYVLIYHILEYNSGTNAIAPQSLWIVIIFVQKHLLNDYAATFVANDFGTASALNTEE